MSKDKYVNVADAETFICPVRPALTNNTTDNKCQGQECMLWIDSEATSGVRVGQGYCGILSTDSRSPIRNSIFMRIIAWF